jgi:hypothetical protein
MRIIIKHNAFPHGEMGEMVLLDIDIWMMIVLYFIRSESSLPKDAKLFVDGVEIPKPPIIKD